MASLNPIDPDRYIGTVSQVTASQVHLNLPLATAHPERRALAKGAVGDFVFVDCERVKLLGRIVETRVPDAERLTVEPQLGKNETSHPIGRVQLLAAVEQGESKLQRGLPLFPRIGDGVFLADPKILAELIRNAVTRRDEIALSIGRIEAADGIAIELPPEKVFGRHCGVFGATGGGKSWTLATLIHQVKQAGGKAVVLDPTGEFANIPSVDTVFVFDAPTGNQRLVHFPYRQVTEDDLFSLFRPSGQSQGPKLREAIKSLKLVAALNGAAVANVHIQNGLLQKASKQRQPFFNALAANSARVHALNCDFDIQKLAEQVANECVWSNQNGNPGLFGGIQDGTLGHCETLISRINTLIHSTELACVFETNGTSLVAELAHFFADDTRSIALVSFKDVRFEHSTREILLNILGRFLLGQARLSVFRDRPIIVFLDEAHQFLGKTVGDEYASVRLDSFGLIAKEGRKYGLTCVLATQRPRDVPPDVLSQLGTLFVHRLTNDQDRETVERACGDLDKGAAQFIPMLAPGEAVVIGPDLPAPVPVFIDPPPVPPDSRGPAFQKYWKQRRDDPQPAPPPIQPAAVAVAAGVVNVAAGDGPGFDDEIPF